MTSAVPAVSVVVEPGVDCPGPAAVERALAELGSADGRPRERSDGWTLRLQRAGDGVRLILRDPKGTEVLARALAAGPPRCQSAAEAVAIIVERYFRDVAWAVDPGRAGPGLPARAGAPAAIAESGPEAAPPPPPPARAFFSPDDRLAVSIGAALWTRQSGVGAVLALRLRVAGPIGVGLGTILPPFRSEQALPMSDGRVQTTGVPVIARISAAGRRGPIGVTLGLDALMTIERGASEQIASPASAARVVFAAGLGLGSSLALRPRMRLSVDAAAFRTLLGRSFVVGGIDGPVLEPPAWQALFGLRLEWIAVR